MAFLTFGTHQSVYWWQGSREMSEVEKVFSLVFTQTRVTKSCNRSKLKIFFVDAFRSTWRRNIHRAQLLYWPAATRVWTFRNPEEPWGSLHILALIRTEREVSVSAPQSAARGRRNNSNQASFLLQFNSTARFGLFTCGLLSHNHIIHAKKCN